MQWIHREAWLPARHCLTALLGASALMMLSGCLGKDKSAAGGEPSQIVAQVNDSEISIHQVQSMMQMQPGLVGQWGEAAADKILDSLIEQELAAQAARKSGLDKSPRVLQAMEIAKREVLARAYQDQLAEKAATPDAEKVDRYYESHPELFANRRQYVLQEIMIQAAPEQVQALKARVDPLGSLDAVNAAVLQSGLPYSSRNTMQWAESLSMDLLPKLAYLKPGQSLTFVQPAGLVILTLIRADDAPMTRAQASKPIQAALLSIDRQALVKEGMQALRQKAKIERKGPLAKPSSAESAASVP